MTETTRPYTTYSELDTFGQCALKHCLSYQGGWRKPQPAGSSLSRGSAWHKVMEQHYLRVRDGVGDPQAVIDEIEDEADRELISWMHDGYVELYGEDEKDWEILEVEKEYVMPLSDDLDLLGRIDLLVRDKRNKKIYIVDHKGLSVDEKVMTPDGFKRNGDLEVGDRVMGRNGKPTRVVGVYDLGKREMYRVTFNDHSYVDTTDDHLWSLESVSGNCRRSRVVTTKDMCENKFPSYRIMPSLSPIQWSSKKLWVDPYCMGVILGDGHCGERSITVTNADPGVWSRLSTHFELGKPFRRGTAVSRNLNSSHRKVYLHYPELRNKRAWEKAIPEIYLYGSEYQRRELLAGILDSDGHVDKRGRTKYVTSSTELKSGVEHLVRSLGGKATSSFHKTGYKDSNGNRVVCRGAWWVSIVLPFTPFSIGYKREAFKPSMQMSRRVSRVEKLGSRKEARCIKVDAPDSLYVTKDCIVTHNTKRNFSSRADIELDDQFALYTWLLRQAGVPVFGFVRSDARTQRNKGPMKLDQRFQRESVYYTDKYLESVASEKLQVVKAMHSGIVYASVSPDLCSWRCDFKEAHMTARAIGKPVDLVVQDFGFTQREGVQ